MKFITDVIPNVLGTWNANSGKPDYLDASKKINTTNNFNSSYLEPENKTDNSRILWEW